MSGLDFVVAMVWFTSAIVLGACMHSKDERVQKIGITAGLIALAAMGYMFWSITTIETRL